MVQSAPDDVFRSASPTAGEAPGGGPDDAGPTKPGPTSPRDGIEPRLLVLMLALAVVAGFFGGRLTLLRFETNSGPVPLVSASAVPTKTSDEAQFAPFVGDVEGVVPDQARGKCSNGRSNEAASALIDQSPSSIWRCHGEGVGERAEFEFDQPVNLAGVRLINGNTEWTNRYEAERRVTAIRWTFEDGSYFTQGLAPNEAAPQEVRFPEITTSTIAMEVLAVTEPGEDSSMANAVSISSLEFLSPA